MEIEMREVGGTSERIAALVDAYSRRVFPAVLEQHGGASVSSALGAWLLLAACVSGAEGEHRTVLEDALGCDANEASELLRAFMASPPRALRAAIAVWVAIADATPRLSDWVQQLPDAVESGFMPTEQEADEWADRNTLGLIKSFPLRIDASTRIVLASALATKVSWPVPFDVVPASEHLGDVSPWKSSVERLLWDSRPNGRAMIADTRAAGLVAVHFAIAEEDLTVISVAADPAVPRAAVMDAAHEVAAVAVGDWGQLARSLFELPLGTGHSWDLAEREVRTYHAGQRIERIAGASLPAWHARSELKLQRSVLFATSPALETLRTLVEARPGDIADAAQTAIASFTRYGFEAAAITGFAVATSARREPDQIGVERSAILRFDRPYAAVAIAGHAEPPRRPGQVRSERRLFDGLPLFTAWISEPREPEGAPPTKSSG